MKTNRLVLLATLACAATVLPTSSASAQATCDGDTTAVTAASASQARQALLCLINNERAAKGVPALAESSALNQGSQVHADDMAARGYKDTDSPDGQNPNTRAAAAGYTAGRNVYGIWLAAGDNPRANAREVVRQAGLCSEILDANVADIGVGVALAADGPRFSVSLGEAAPPSGPNPACPLADLSTPESAPAAATPLAAAQALASQPAATVAGKLGFPSTKSCQSKRAFYIRIKEPKPIKIKSATLTLAGRKIVAKRSGGRLRALIDLRGFAKGSFKVGITAKTTTGVTLKGSRSYKTCATKKANL